MAANSEGCIFAVDLARIAVLCTFSKAHGKSAVSSLARLSVPEVEGDTLFASAAFDGQVRVWSFERRGLVAFVQAHEMGVNKVLELGSGELVTAGNDRTLKLFEPDLFSEDVDARLPERVALNSSCIINELLKINPKQQILLTKSFQNNKL